MLIPMGGRYVAAAEAPSYLSSFDQPTDLTSGGTATDTFSLPGAGDYVVFICSIGDADLSATIDNGTVANSGEPIVEYISATPNSGYEHSITAFHITATAAATVTITQALATASLHRRGFIYDAGDATATVRSSAVDNTHTSNELSVTLSGLTAGDRIFACVVDRNDQADGGSGNWGAVWGDDLTGDEDAQLTIGTTEAHGGAVASDTATGASFTGSVSDSGIDNAALLLVALQT